MITNTLLITCGLLQAGSLIFIHKSPSIQAFLCHGITGHEMVTIARLKMVSDLPRTYILGSLPSKVRFGLGMLLSNKK